MGKAAVPFISTCFFLGDDDSSNRNNRSAYTTAALGLGDDVVDQWFVTAVSMTSGVDDIFRINGEEVFSGNMLSSGMDGIKVGMACNNSYKFTGRMCELIVYEGDLSQAEIEAIEGQLMARWGLGGSAPLVGDLNGDGLVGSADLDIVRAAWGESVDAGCLACGDPSGDGMVGSADLDIVRANWGATYAAAVPEPATVLLLAMLGLLAAAIRRK